MRKIASGADRVASVVGCEKILVGGAGQAQAEIDAVGTLARAKLASVQCKVLVVVVPAD